MRLAWLPAPCIALAACAAQSSPSPWVVLPVTSDTSGARVTIVGTVQHASVEGGFYAIRADDGTTYDPTNLPQQFQQDGLAVEADARKQENMAGIHQVGPIVQLIRIRTR